MVFEFRLPSNGDEGCHVEGGSDLRSAAEDSAMAAECAAISIEGRDADEFGDLLSGERAEFGQEGHESGLDDRSEPLDGAPRAGEVGAGEFGDALVEDEQFGAERPDGPAGEGLELRDGQALELLSLLLDGEDNLSAAGDEGREIALPGAWRAKPVEFVVQACCHVSEDAGVDGVGFCELALCASEVAGLSGIDAGNGEAFVDEGVEQWHLEATGGLDDDEGFFPLTESFDEPEDSGAGVVEALGGGKVMASQIEERLADVDTDTNHEGSPLKWGSREHSRQIPALSVRTIVGQLFGRRSEDPTCGAMLVTGRRTERETGTHVGLSALTIAEQQEIKRKATRLSRVARCASAVPCSTRH